MTSYTMAASISLQDSFFIKRLGSHTYLVNLNYDYTANPAASSAGYLGMDFRLQSMSSLS